MAKKYFTLEEANELLPAIRHDLLTLQQTKQNFEAKYVELKRKKMTTLENNGQEDPFFAQELEMEFMQIEANGLIQHLHNRGIEVKHIDHGLVDFPAIVNGKEVLLCWKQGEECIAYYHNVDEGFAGRKSLL